MSFVNLHNHSDAGSALDGLGTVKAYAQRAAELGQPAIAVTDHGSLTGSLSLQRECDKVGIQAIWGCESYMAPLVDGRKDSRHHKDRVFYKSSSDSGEEEGGEDVSGNGAYTHATLLACSTEGIHNLIEVNSESWESGLYRKPRADQELLEASSGGLVYLTGCPSSEINTRLRLGDVEGAERYLSWALDVFGRDRVFLEVMDHGFPKGSEIERASVSGLLHLHQRFGVPFVATNDSHYVFEDNRRTHEQLLCVNTGSQMSQLPRGEWERRVNGGESPQALGSPRFAFDGSGYHLRSRAEMERALPSVFEGALDNTLLIAEMCQGARLENVSDQSLWIDMSTYMPSGYAADKKRWITDKARSGLMEIRRRFGAEYTQEDERQLLYEMDVIDSKGYTDYFAFFWDFSHHMRSTYKTLMNTGRGSAAGCLVSYGLGITLLDPMRYNLIFERFLNPERESPPDIDFDIPDRLKPAAMRYVADKYGHDAVAFVTTLGTFKPRQALKDVLRVEGVEYQTSERMTKLLGDVKGFDDASEDFWNAIREAGLEERVEDAKQLTGATRQYGTHASAVIASSTPIRSYAPTKLSKDKETGEYILSTQWEYPLLEELGFVKFDFLGLSTLTIVSRCLELIEKNHGITINVEELIQGPMDDDKTYAMLNKGHTAGVFQVEGSGITETVQNIQVKSINDLAAVLGLYRPGPMAMGSHVSYAKANNGEMTPPLPHDDFYGTVVENILSNTHNLLVFQEQVMNIASQGCGMSLAKADHLRAAMGKKKIDIMLSMKDEFIEGGMKVMGVSRQAMDAMWDTIVPFSEYGFNASHAYGYATLTYATAYLKANYAPEFMAALIYSLTYKTKKNERLAIALAECRSLRIPVLPPSCLSPDEYTTSDGVSVFLGLKSMKGVGSAARHAIVENAPYVNVTEFADKIGKASRSQRLSPIRSSDLNTLINGGFFDQVHPNRRALSLVSDDVIARIKTLKDDDGQETLFGFLDDMLDPIVVPDNVEDFPRLERLRWEKELLSMYASGHPIDNVRPYLKQVATANASTLDQFAWKPVTVAGMVTEAASGASKKDGSRWSRWTIEDANGDYITVFGYRETALNMIPVAEGNVVVVSGVCRVNKDSGEATISPESSRLVSLDEDGYPVIRITVTRETLSEFTDDELHNGVGGLLRVDEDLGEKQKITVHVVSFNKMRELGSLVEDRTMFAWEKVIAESGVELLYEAKNALAPRLAVSLWGDASVFEWKDRLMGSYERWRALA